MPRRSYKKPISKLEPAFKSVEITKLVNNIMKDGKKTVAQGIVFEVIEKFNKEGKDGVEMIHTAIKNVSPRFEVKPRRLGGASYLVPTEVRPERRLFLALKWLIEATRARANKEFKTFAIKLYTEIKDASQNQGAAMAKKQQVEKLAETNKAFSHLKW